MSKIEPRILKGFRDYLPDITIERQRMIRALEKVFASFGFAPIDTPALEYAEILLGKGSDETDKQLYRFKDNGDRDVALRFDLTVPLARFVAMHINELGTPFKRFHIAPVWRAEKPQKGRYREFIQCDFDIIGTRAVGADAEIVGVIHSALSALNIRHRIRINNRNILNGLLESLNCRAQSVAILRAIDKLEKIGKPAVEEELTREAGLSAAQISSVFSFLELSENTDSAGLLGNLAEFFKGRDSTVAEAGITQLSTIISLLPNLGLNSEDFEIDLSIARGLDYYTGIVFETVWLDMPGIGSICSGGRYDNLAGLYTNRDLPGVGASVGLDRIIGGLDEAGTLPKRSSLAEALVTVFDDQTQPAALKLASELRKQGIAVEVFPEPAKIANQIKYADKRGIDYVIFAGENEIKSGNFGVKNIKTGSQEELGREQLAQFLSSKR